ncbi:MAG: M20/M25/M40 family metallo-hydrolase [Coriobacteriia bacterium]|nr:M20/M25/M40 family metallo-hydrolase [Coriobacteriia bacterium]
MSSPEDERLLATFLELVRIDSPAGSEAAVGRYMADALVAAGMSVRFDSAQERTDSECGNLIAELPGTVAGMTLVFSGHMDTVEPGRGIVPVVEDGVVRSAGETILGSDDKAGLAAIIECVRRVTGGGLPHPPLRVIITVGEEMGLQGAKALDAADATGDLCLVLDADGAPGGIVTASPTHHTFKATFQGRAAHAGVEPEKGRSAAVMACEAVAAMRIGRIDDETTCNIGRIEGGGATNVVTAACVLTGECRSLDAVKAEAIRIEMDTAMSTSAAAHDGTVRILWTKEYDGFRFADDDPLVVLVSDACREAGLTPRLFQTGGGSDGNALSAKGLPSLVLASGMTNVHGTGESVRVEDLEALTRLLLATIERARR